MELGSARCSAYVVRHHPRKAHYYRPRNHRPLYCILKRADPDLYQFMQYGVNACDPTFGENYALVKQSGQQLIENCREVVSSAPLYKDGEYIQAKTRAPFANELRSNVPNCIER